MNIVQCTTDTVLDFLIREMSYHYRYWYHYQYRFYEAMDPKISLEISEIGKNATYIILSVSAIMTYIISVLADKGPLPKLKSIFKYYVAVMEHPVRSSAI